MRFRSSIGSIICSILLFGAAAAAELPAPEYWMQEDLKDLPPALQRLVIFQPDPGQLMAFSTTSARTLYYSRSVARTQPKGCSSELNERWTVSITDHGLNVAAAREAIAGYLEEWSERTDVTIATTFSRANDGRTFVIDKRAKQAAGCGVHRTVTLFRTGAIVVMTSEEDWTGMPAEPHLAPRLIRLLGRRI